MADIKSTQASEGSLLPWIVALVLLLVVVGWLLYRNNQLPRPEGLLIPTHEVPLRIG